ncbi:MAG: TolC family protein [Sutterella wadsworthensis]
MRSDRTYGYGAVATLPVFAGGRIVSGVEAAKALKARAGSELRGAEQDVKMKVAERYVNVLQAQRALELAELHERTLQAHAADVEALQKGFVVKTDRLAAEVWVKNARQDVIRARNALSLAKSAYNREIGRPLDAEARLEEPALPRSFRAARLRSSSAPSERTPPSRASGTPTRRSPRRRRPKRAPISRRWLWPAAG